MRNTYNISLLRKRIVDALPRPPTAIGEAAIEGFLSLPGSSAWRPDRIGLRELSFVFDIGVPLALIGDNASAKPIALEIGDAARDGALPQRPTRSLVHTAALLSRWGWAVQFVGAGTALQRQWRIEVATAEGEPIDVVLLDAGTQRNGSTIDPATSDRLQLLVSDVDGGLEDVAAGYDPMFESSRNVCGGVVFQPRFWIGIEQKEWLHLARPNPTARVAIASERLGHADGERHALRLPLLV